MANIFAIHSVGNSIATFLRNTYPQKVATVDMPACGFELISSGELAGTIDDATRVTLFLYRVTVNEYSRQNRPAGMAPEQIAPLGLDLHFMLTAWAGNALDEHATLGWAARQLHQFSILDASSLSPEAGWASDEVIQIIPAELTTEDMMRVWDALEPAYRLSVSYIARVVRLDPDVMDSSRPAVARRFTYGQEVAA
ncbi:MAG TPA: DUF4255 domain-containing protein [Rhodocyclaceae bacterium]|nr:DUF4255 domain-containing protein [Rhodocyclaceae bacterium]